MTAEILVDHLKIWETKPVLRAIYQDYYQRIVENMSLGGEVLEIGGGSGNLKKYIKNAVSTDIVSLPWLDSVCDAHSLPFKDETFSNIVAVDVLHHLERPIKFLGETVRTLKPGGRLVLLEPAITKLSWFFYHFMHPEPVILDTNPLEDAPLSPDRKPFDANQAIPELIFGKYQSEFSKLFPELIIKKKQYFSLVTYPLSGGFRKWSLIPKQLVRPFLALEKNLEPMLGKWFGFRLFIVLEKK